MSRVYLHWEGPFTILDSPALDATMGIYMFVDNDRDYGNKFIPRKVLYIGMTYYQAFRQEIQAKLREDLGKWLEQNRFDTTVMVAYVETIDQERISEALVRDIENLLIMVIRRQGISWGKRATVAGGRYKLLTLGNTVLCPRWFPQTISN